MKGVVFGKGFLGTKIAESFGYLSTGIRINDDSQSLDELRSFLNEERPDIVVNAIGKTGRPNIDWCETHREETRKANTDAPIILSRECADRKIRFVHIGSGCVFKGDNDGKGFTEKDEPNFYGPQYYAITKIDAERELKKLPGLLLRIRMPIDGKPHDRNLIDKLKGYERIIDEPNSMTTVPDMLKSLKGLIDKDRDGIYNLTNPGTISPKEIMEKYKEIVDSSHSFRVMSLDELNEITAGIRSNCVLNSSKLEAEDLELPEIHGAVISCLQEYRQN